MRLPSRSLRCVAAAALVLCGAAGAALADDTPGVPSLQLPAQAQGQPPSWAGRAYRQGVVAVSHPLAAEVGARVLERGGNAVDAAAAIQFALNVVEPQFSGIGGGGFMLVHLAHSGRTYAVDARETAPAAAGPRLFDAVGNSFAVASTSGLSVGVPGTLAGVSLALRQWGTLSLPEALQPAIGLAEKGFRINRFLAANITQDGGRTTNYAATRRVFRHEDGSPLQEGDLLVQPDLARTFRLIAQQGPDVFYRGEIARAIVAAQQQALVRGGEGLMTAQDLAGYVPKLREPVTVDYRGWQLVSMSPPSSGGLTVGQMLRMLRGFPLGDAAQGYGFGGARTLHVTIEAMRLAFADRAVWMGDADFVDVPVRGLLDDRYTALRANDIRADLSAPQPRMATPRAGNPWPFQLAARDADAPPLRLAAIPFEEEKGVHTTHFSVVDKWGNVVSYTTTIENTWGTGITVPGYGFLLNNELTDFNLSPTANADTGNPGANDVAPGKRPRSSMAPSLLMRGGRPVAAFGSPGGSTIINSVLNTTLNLVDHGMTVQQAINAPRLSVTSALGTVSCETGQPFMQPAFNDGVLQALQRVGHFSNAATGALACSTTPIGSVQAVVIDLRTGKQYGGADPRREGTVIGLPRQ